MYEYGGYPYYQNQRQFFPGFFQYIFPGGGQAGPGYPHPGPFPGGPGGPAPFPGGPGGMPGGPGGAPVGPGGGGGQVGAPTSPPPSFTPEQPQFQTFAVDPGAIRGCLYRFTYVWLRRGSFWFYPTFVGRNSVAGFRWQRFRWVYFGIDLDKIQSFQCF